MATTRTVTATFSSGHSVTRNSKSKVYTHAVYVTRNGEGRGVFFASSAELATRQGNAEVKRMTKFDPVGLEFEVVAVVVA